MDMGDSSLKFLSNDAREMMFDKKANKVEKMKMAKGGHKIWTDIPELGKLIREGKTKWEDLDLDDIDTRAKWAGMFHRRKRTPGKFMMRLKVPNGELNAEQLRHLGQAIAPYGADGCADITTRANIQLRGMPFEGAAQIFEGLTTVGLSSVQSGMDNVRNMTGSPIAGIDPHELLDVRPLNKAIDNMITNNGYGNEELCNLPRKINICLSASRDDFPHTHINDVGLQAARDPETGEVGFNLEVGGYFSIKRYATSIFGNTWVRLDQVVPYCKAVLEVFRDYGERKDRQKARLLWLIEDWGVDKFRDKVAEYMGDTLAPGKHIKYDDVWKRRSVLGIHPQKQDGLFWACASVPVGRLHAQDFFDLADVAERYGDGTLRFSVEQDVVFPNIPEDRLADLQQEALFQRFPLDPGPILGGLVSCTGSQFCGVAMIETKNRALDMTTKLQEQLDFPRPIRIHWTGCPNSCGQAQCADIGLMGGPAKLNGKAVEGVRIFLGGTIGEGATLASEFEKGIPCEESILLPKLKDICMEHFGATPKQEARELVTA
jgi:ferredoxin-nitrite reductase